MRTPIFRVSDQVWHKPGCTSIKMYRSLKFQIWKVERLCCRFSKTKVADLQRICTFEFAYAQSRFTHDAARTKSVKLAQIKALISFPITQLICAFDFSHIQKAGFLMMSLKIKSSYIAQTRALISLATTVQSSDLHLCFNICKSRFSHEAAPL